jgi:hypothetical protein
MAIAPDAGQLGTGGMTTRYSAPMRDAGLPVTDYMAPMPVDAARRDSGGGMVALYAAPVPAGH